MASLRSRPSFSRNILPIVAVVGVIVAAFLIWRGLPDRQLETPAETPARATGALANAPRVAGAGVVEPSSEVIDIGTALSGLVTAVLVRPGDYVTRGQPLFRVDERAVRARLGEAEAAIREAGASISEARAAESTAARQLALYRKVGDPAAVSRSEVIGAEGEVSAARERRRLAEARLAAARASRNSTGVELNRLTVAAPISGEILRVDVRPGEYVQAGVQGGASTTPYIQMGETRPLHVRIDIDEDEAARVAIGAAAVISPRGAANRQVRATFVRAEPQVVPKRSLTNSAAERVDVRVLQLIYQLPQTDGLFRVGQQVDAFIAARPAQGQQRQAAAR
ncbi:MAG: ABC-type export system, membrane fusion protein [uncultured Sphingomonas sp.]|uniref:ABC-type export system, membrane fusion protein n=1 Tax=uncultured Sphingomonas sp. TaxID=158754 RepID=A0A6J4T582_9SPHN|nr:biotin/lipoyl-binding protein [uncultured Sphingomonas sp.]CAA9514504.1 MAG: ABC-type export system, membrane fusion protein [uncultured Sphingomonas sp.]